VESSNIPVGQSFLEKTMDKSYSDDFEVWKRGYKPEVDPHYKEKVSKIRKETGRSFKHCSWMLQICSGDSAQAIKLLNEVGYRSWA
jgi:hypothetical protein